MAKVSYCKGASPNYFGKGNDVGGGGGGGGVGVQARDVIRCTDQINGGQTPDINDVMGGGGGGGL